MTQTTMPTSSPRSPTGSFLRAVGVTKSFKMGDSPVTVLKQADIEIKPGEFLAIEGRSGSGKSTLLHILAGLDAVDHGRLNFEGHDYTRLTESPSAGFFATIRRISLPVAIASALISLADLMFSSGPKYGFAIFALPLLAISLVTLCLGWLIPTVDRTIRFIRHERPVSKLRNQHFGFVFQFYHLLPELDVLENTMLAPMISHGSLGFIRRRGATRKRATELLESLGMGHRLKHRPNQLSGGERQRVAIARALMNSPRVLFADEPTGNLDAETGRQIMGVLERLHREQNQTIVMVTHDRTLARTADRVLVLKDGALAPAE